MDQTEVKVHPAQSAVNSTLLGVKSVLTASQKAQFDRDGFIIVRNLLDQEETDILVRTAKSDPAFKQHAHGVADPDGKKVKMALWNHPSDDVYGTISRLPKVVDTLEHLLGDEVYHYHSKMVIKEPFTGGSFCWHQDYGYWYLNGCLFPDMGSVMVAVDPNTKENGCLQVLKGSHLLGRVEHGRYGEQTGADPERCEQAQKALELVYCEMAPGDALFFHCNTLHRSQANTSPHPRWSLLCCYNTKHNNPYKESHHPFYEPLVKAQEDAVRRYGVRQAEVGKRFWHPSEDKTVGAD
ncbi:phytanoyl-CoA hydroxylase [Klebsormidium nitens]|uniref:Phytanoyl-CoA hydroxylase n=1 Tax=Klebsormidium nitens TaxID=105231 RepID=A0A1Y1I3U6_KLENI|nr:phytanoyl-CoA hydroxylase [Klebsormidium nitens]|eukprot:GAQ85615.1 phytanoyl-CoA hydroxylase [Klebsormidium nitens]